MSKAERQKQQEVRQAKDYQAAEDRRRQKEQDASENAERRAIEAYWESLTLQQQAELDAASNAKADPGSTGPGIRATQTHGADHPAS